MPGPATSKEALVWIREAMVAKRYLVDPHFQKRCRQRGFSVFDAKRIVATATACVPYQGGPALAGGTSWRVTGQAADESVASVGVEAFRDHLGNRVILITIMDS
jgi:hypothetical protein